MTTMTTLTADDEHELALDIAARTVTQIEAAEARMGHARKSLDSLMLDVLPTLNDDEERAEMWRRTGHVCQYLRAVEVGEFEAAEKFRTTMQAIQRDSRRPPYLALHIEESRILAFTEAWVAEALPNLDDAARAHVVRALLAPREAPEPTHDWRRPSATSIS